MYISLSQDSTTSTAIGITTYYGSTTGFSVAVDGDDNVFLVGGTYNSLVFGAGDPGDYDYFIVKLNGATGTEIFAGQGGLSYHHDSFRGVSVNSEGDIVAAGSSGYDTLLDFLVVKFSGATGNMLWEYSPHSSTIDVLRAVTFDSDDNVYVAGAHDALNLQGSIAENPSVTKLSGSTGTEIWVYEGIAASSAIFKSVTVDPLNRWVVGAGYTGGTWLTGAAQGSFDFAAVVLDGDTGDEVVRYQTGGPGTDILYFAGFDAAGALFLVGSSDSGGDSEMVGIKLSLEPETESKALAEGEIGAIIGAVILLLLLCLCTVRFLVLFL